MVFDSGFDFTPYVIKGMEWLDRVKPGWEDSVDLRRLQVEVPVNCVLGQVFAEEFTQVIQAADLIPTARDSAFHWIATYGYGGSHVDPSECGFDLPEDVEEYAYDMDEEYVTEDYFAELTDTWKFFLNKRKEQANA